ncbi:oligosaccharide flippase family protein [Paenibacillus nanensis]|uniref:oligosaccharide flippase family protein n=1 Tax=Paenibacillus nanensis TaxID=393251 RepID=UPI0013C34E9D|nr:oligosaccharide flippase family protein [Paenibacillus nanensis]
MDKQVIKRGIVNTIYVIGAQSVSFLLSIARTLMLPMLLGVTNFGYWSVYLLYMSYAGVLALGYNDGIYLKYGKYSYQDLPKKNFRSGLRLFILLQFVITMLVCIFLLFETNSDKQLALYWVAMNIPIAGLTGVFIYVLQITNQLKRYSFYSVLDKAIVLLAITVVFFLKIDNYLIIIIADTISRLVVLILLTITCRQLVFGKSEGSKAALKELSDNIRVGIKLMAANFSGMLVLGLGRFIIERFESVEVYSKYSFALSTTNLVLVFVSAVGLVVYPTLNRLEEKKIPIYFSQFNRILSIIMFALLIVFFPLKIFIDIYIPDYNSIFNYLPIVFSIVLIQTKMQILINPFYKVLRKENAMLIANITGLLISIISIIPLYLINQSVTMIAFGTMVAMSIRLYSSELYLRKIQNIKIDLSNMITEITGVIIFIVCAYCSNVTLGFLFFFLIYSVYLLTQIKNIGLFLKRIVRR